MGLKVLGKWLHLRMSEIFSNLHDSTENTQNWPMHTFRPSYQHKRHQRHLQMPEQHLQACREDYLYFFLLPFIMAGRQKEPVRKTKMNKLDMASQGEGKVSSPALDGSIFPGSGSPTSLPSWFGLVLATKAGLVLPTQPGGE